MSLRRAMKESTRNPLIKLMSMFAAVTDKWPLEHHDAPQTSKLNLSQILMMRKALLLEMRLDQVIVVTNMAESDHELMVSHGMT